MTNPTLERAMKAIDMTVDFREGWMIPESAERTARAVLMAVREPSEKIVEVGHDQIDFHDTTSREYQIFQLSMAFTAIIDAILADGGE